MVDPTKDALTVIEIGVVPWIAFHSIERGSQPAPEAISAYENGRRLKRFENRLERLRTCSEHIVGRSPMSSINEDRRVVVEGDGVREARRLLL